MTLYYFKSLMFLFGVFLNFRTFSVIVLIHFKPMFHFYTPEISESSGFLIFDGVRNRTLPKLDYQQYWFVVLSYFKLMFLSYTL